ncbi:MAG: phenylalanine--tRNA ligase subunit alpha [Acidobacteriaceae bacterium]
MNENISQIRHKLLEEIEAAIDKTQLSEIDNRYFGRQQGKLTHILRGLKNLPEDERRKIGIEANRLKQEATELIERKSLAIKSSSGKFVDLTAYPEGLEIGHLHPITLIRRDIENVFRRLGFATVKGPEVETDYYNFESLNMPAEHPARDMWDTFYVKDSVSAGKGKPLLRTHISPVQSRIMEKHKPPFAVISSGRVFRHESTDARHEHTYDYTEGLLVSKDANLAQLKWVLNYLFVTLFGEKVKIKFRPSYFPFTEPSLELLMACIFCNAKGCSVCHTGWLEMLGAGMVHPTVFDYAKYPKGKYSGFAFGIGISRVAMLKYNIPDIRYLYQNDLRLIKQF